MFNASIEYAQGAAGATTGKEGPIAKLWMEMDVQRRGILDEARICAALAGKPYILPPENHPPNAQLPETYQSIGSRGTTNMEGKFVLALFPPDQSWLNLTPAAKYLSDKTVDPADLLALEQDLFAREVALMALLETPRLDMSGRYTRSFRTTKRKTIAQILVTGDVLEYLDDEYRLTAFRRDQYCTLRNSSGDVLQHAICEIIDPLSLTDEQLGKCGINREETKKKPVGERMRRLWTRVEWQPYTKVWNIVQEINGASIYEKDEKVSPYFCTAFELSPGENYGRGFVGLNRGDLSSLDNCNRYILNIAALAAKQHPIIDPGSNIKPKDLLLPSGTPLQDSVAGGVVQKVGFLASTRIGEFNILANVRDSLRADLGKAMLITSETAPRGESGRSPYAWQQIAQELDGATGGMYSSINDEQQIPLAARLIYQATRDKIIRPLDADHYDVRVVTGIAALMRQIKRDRLIGFGQLVASLGPEATRKVDTGVMLEILARYDGILEPGLIKTKQQEAAEINQAIQQEAAIAANAKAVDVAGNVAQAALAPQGTP